jgi:hypothetical protein
MLDRESDIANASRKLARRHAWRLGNTGFRLTVVLSASAGAIAIALCDISRATCKFVRASIRHATHARFVNVVACTACEFERGSSHPLTV